MMFGAGAAHATGATGTFDGTCPPEAERGLTDLSDAVAGALAAANPDPQAAVAALTRELEAKKTEAALKLPPKCVAEDDAYREARERQEIERIEAAVKAAAKDQCAKTTCVGNATYLVTGYSHNFFNFFGGCENWSRLATDTLGGNLQYHTIEREQRCNFPGHCHYVVVLRNARTKDVRTVDAWSYAGGWVLGGVRKKDASVFGSYDEFKSNYGLRVDHETGFGRALCY